MANAIVTRRILVRKIAFKTAALVEGLSSGPCKRRTAVEQSENLVELVSRLDELTRELAALDANTPAE